MYTCVFLNTDVKGDFVPLEESMPGQCPVYLRLPYRKDHYFCLYKEDQQTEFISILSDCIRHQNKGIKTTYETTQPYVHKDEPVKTVLLSNDIKQPSNVIIFKMKLFGTFSSLNVLVFSH